MSDLIDELVAAGFNPVFQDEGLTVLTGEEHRPSPLEAKLTIAQGKGLDFLRVYKFKGFDPLVALIGNKVYLVDTDGSWEAFEYSALSDLSVQYSLYGVLHGREAMRILLDFSLIEETTG